MKPINLNELRDKGYKVLNLTLNKRWFDMILSGEKKEEYREVKKHWIDRLCMSEKCSFSSNHPTGMKYEFAEFDYILFTNGYSSDSRKILIEWNAVSVDYGKLEWGAKEFEKYFVIDLGEIIQTENL